MASDPSIKTIDYLFHVTGIGNIEGIKKHGLQPGTPYVDDPEASGFISTTPNFSSSLDWWADGTPAISENAAFMTKIPIETALKYCRLEWIGDDTYHWPNEIALLDRICDVERQGEYKTCQKCAIPYEEIEWLGPYSDDDTPDEWAALNEFMKRPENNSSAMIFPDDV